MRRVHGRLGWLPQRAVEETDTRIGKAAHGLPGTGRYPEHLSPRHKKPELISPDNWNMDACFMERPQARRIQMEFFYDYRTNVTLYPKWQEFLRRRSPKTIIFWGQDDIFFTREGGEAYLRDLPQAEMHRLESGHFAVEDCLEYIARNILRFFDEKVASK